MQNNLSKSLFLLKNKKHFLSIVLFLLCISTYSQTPSVVRNIRIPLWSELDAYPGLEEAQDIEAGVYDYPIKNIRETAPFIFSGMIYGWRFVYTPSDKSRGVEEYFEVSEIEDLEKLGIRINYSSPWIENNRLNCWCEYRRTDFQIQNYNLWSSIQNPVIHGRGFGDLEKGFVGLKDAAKDSLKTAVRNYYRNKIKNKPKEISGAVLIKDIPTIGLDAGRYVINLDFFLECGKIIEYTQF